MWHVSVYQCPVLLLTSVFLNCAGQYLNLDKDHNGMLSKEELSRYGTATLTSVFLDRVFQECLTYEGEMVRSITLTAGVLTAVAEMCLVVRSGDCEDFLTHLQANRFNPELLTE